MSHNNLLLITAKSTGRDTSSNNSEWRQRDREAAPAPDSSDHNREARAIPAHSDSLFAPEDDDTANMDMGENSNRKAGQFDMPMDDQDKDAEGDVDEEAEIDISLHRREQTDSSQNTLNYGTSILFLLILILIANK